MHPTTVLTGAKAKEKIIAGVHEVYDALRRTLGPAGRNALLSRTMNRGPRSTNDGYTISENIKPKDPHKRLVAEFFKEGSRRTNQLAGDGTTGTAVIGGHLVEKVMRMLPDDNIPRIGQAQTNVMALRNEMKEGVKLVIDEIKKQATPVTTLEELKKVARVSIENDEAADIIAELMFELGVDGDVLVTEGYKGKIEVEKIPGMRFPAKVPARVFVNKPERHEMVAEDVPILITNYKIDNEFQIAEILNRLKQQKIAIIAPDFSERVLMAFVQAIRASLEGKGGMVIYPIKTPSLRTVRLEDIAIATGGTLIDKDTGAKLENVYSEQLGFAEKIVVKETENKEDALLHGGKGEKTRRGDGNQITERIAVLKGQLEESRNDMEKGQLKQRIADLSSAIGIVRVGAITDAELLYLKLKIEDGVYACQAALAEGYVKGGGLCLKEIADTLPDDNILKETLLQPYEEIQRNTGGIEISDDIIDPAKVIRLEVEHGVSIASQLITTDILIEDVKEDSPSEGYGKIAKALMQGNYFRAKERGQMRESEELVEQDNARMWAEAAFSDID